MPSWSAYGVERRTREIEEARGELERKAEQLSLTSKYKSQFLANMSHELRTPLNSLLILSKQLAENGPGNMTPQQVEFAQTIGGAGRDLLTLINDRSASRLDGFHRVGGQAHVQSNRGR